MGSFVPNNKGENMTKKNVLRFLIGIAIVLFIIIIIFVVPIYNNLRIEALQEQYWQAQNEDVQQHIKLWNEQKIATYKIGINISIIDIFQPPGTCTKEFIVDHGQIAKTI